MYALLPNGNVRLAKADKILDIQDRSVLLSVSQNDPLSFQKRNLFYIVRLSKAAYCAASVNQSHFRGAFGEM